MTESAAAGMDSRGSAVVVHCKALARDLWGALLLANLPGLASQVAYSLIFAMPSLLLVVALVVGDIDQRTGFALTDEMRLLILDALPPEVQVVANLITDAMLRASEGPTTISAIVSILVALLAAGSGLGELALAFDRAAGISDPRPPLVQRLIFTASSVVIAMVLILAFALYVWGGDLIALVSERVGWRDAWQSGWEKLHSPMILLLVFLGTSLLYMVSSGQYAFRLAAPGAAVATILWMMVVRGFQIYLQIAQPGTAYGAASSVLVFLVFLYLSSMALIIGAMVAAVLVRQSRACASDERSRRTALHAGRLEPGSRD
jgi:membrane protein